MAHDDLVIGDSTTVNNEEYVREVVTRAVVTLAPVQTGPVKADQYLYADLGYDSLRLIRLSFLIEELFQTEFDPAEAPSVPTVADLQDYVVQMVNDGLVEVPDQSAVDVALAAG